MPLGELGLVLGSRSGPSFGGVRASIRVKGSGWHSCYYRIDPRRLIADSFPSVRSMLIEFLNRNEGMRTTFQRLITLNLEHKRGPSKRMRRSVGSRPQMAERINLYLRRPKKRPIRDIGKPYEIEGPDFGHHHIEYWERSRDIHPMIINVKPFASVDTDPCASLRMDQVMGIRPAEEMF